MTSSLRSRLAIFAQVVLLVYFEVCVLIPLGSWNLQPGMEHAFSRQNLVLGGIIAFAQGLLLAATIWRVRALQWVGLLGDFVWLILHGTSLWKPYIFGASPEYGAMYTRVFGRTTKLLPSFGNHLAPDGMHIFIDLFLVFVITALLIDLMSPKRTHGAAEVARFNG